MQQRPIAAAAAAAVNSRDISISSSTIIITDND